MHLPCKVMFESVELVESACPISPAPMAPILLSKKEVFKKGKLKEK